MNEMDERESILKKDMMIVGILGLGSLNGMHFSPWFDFGFLVLRPFLEAGFFISSPLLIFYFTALIISTISVMLAGVPAALFERLTKRTESDPTSLYIWLGAMLMISIPALLAAAQSTNLGS